MFERYTERARRVTFFARYEASHLGSTTIETEHLLLGLIREDKNLTSRFLLDSFSIEGIVKEIKGRSPIREKVSRAVDLPLSGECKRILAYAAEEAEALNHRHIGTEHLLLGILREETCLAGRMLHGRGLRLDAIRKELANSPAAAEGGPDDASPMNSFLKDAMVPDAETAKCIATAIWLPAYGDMTSRGEPVAEVVRINVWRVTAGPLFAFISASDGKILGMGKSQTGIAGV